MCSLMRAMGMIIEYQEEVLLVLALLSSAAPREQQTDGFSWKRPPLEMKDEFFLGT